MRFQPLSYLLIIYTLFIQLSHSFQFKAVDVLPNSYYVNIQTTYTIHAYRDTLQDLNPTTWDTQSVPAGSKVVITFPNQCILNNPSCTKIEITTIDQFIISTGYNCAVNGRQLTISNIFTSSLYIKNLVITLGNIVNPSLALTTDNFVVKIGSDTSADTSQASITIISTSLIQVNATFDSKIVNTTGNLVVTFASQNIIRPGSQVVIQFPALLQWARDISSSHQIPLNNVLSCSGVTSNIKSSLACSGSVSDRSITISSINSVDINPNQTISFKVGQLFSPPSIQQVDYIGVKIKSLYTDGYYYELDSDKTKITSLVAKTMSVSFSSTAKMTVNSKIAIQLDIILADTINQADTIKIYLPSTTSFIFNDTKSSTSGFFINSTLTTYDPVNKILLMKQRTQTAINFANKAISLQLSSFYAPPSTKQLSITFQILRSTYPIAQGIAYTNAVANVYAGNVTGVDLGINRVTRYDIVLDVKDAHTNLMMIEIMLPIALKIDSSTFSAKTSLSVTIVPTITITNGSQQMITLSNLINSTGSLIAIQIMTISLYNVTNPQSVKSIGNFQIRTYYNSDYQQKVSQSNISTILMSVNGVIQQNSVRLIGSQLINYQLTGYSLQFVIQNVVQINGYFMISFPIQLDISQLSSINITTTTIQSQLISFTILNTSSIKITNNITKINSSTQIIFTLNNIRNPTSTKPTAIHQVQIHSYNSLSQTIDILDTNNNIVVQSTTTNLLNNTLLERTSAQNDQISNWKITFNQIQKLYNNQKIILTIDNTAIIPSTLACIDSTTLSNLNCSKLSTKPSLLSNFTSAKNSFTYISIDIPTSYTNSSIFQFIIQNIQNPPSYTAFSILLFTISSDYLYLYSSIEQSYLNSRLSTILIGSYGFSKRQLKESATLTFNYTVISSFTTLFLQFQTTGFVINSVICSSIQWTDITCIVVDNDTLKLSSSSSNLIIPKSANIIIQNIVTPSIQNIAPLYIKLYSFDINNQSMGSNINTISYTLQCQFPCKTCTSTNTSECLSCYKSPLTLKQFLGQDKKCYQQCPDGYNQNIDTYQCQKCSLPCLVCNNVKTNCTACNLTSDFIYLSYNSLVDSSTCVKTCQSKYFPDTNILPVYCQQCQGLCLQCKSKTFCLSCQTINTSTLLYLYNGACLNSCPSDITVVNTTDNSCIRCSAQCKTCAINSSNCTTCADTSINYQGKCLLNCPNNLIKYNSTCFSCDIKCQTCSILPANCTSCVKLSNYSFLNGNQCLGMCPNFYYANSNNTCLECTKLSIGCKNCSSETTCNSCDSSYVLLSNKCLTTIPSGYINISGVAVPCSGDCKTCQGTVQNCTSCKTLNLNGNLCQSACDIGQTSVNQVCLACQYPCQLCSGQTFLCSSCYFNSSTFLYGTSCIQNCPDKFYKNMLDMTCARCISPCEKCSDDTICLTCVAGNYFHANTSQCLAVCPDKMVGQNKICVDCQSPCVTCTQTKTTCLTCLQSYFYSSSSSQCLVQCPSGSIKNQLSRTCLLCQRPCQTCQNQTNICLSCANGYNIFQNQCLAQCPNYYYASGNKCTICIQPCLTCTSQIICTSCQGVLKLYKQQCVSNCPKQYGKIINNVCTQCDTGCYGCQSSGICTECNSGYIFYLQQCIKQCPTGYIQSQVNNTVTCIIKQEADVKLQTALSSISSSLFPLPFTIFGLIIIGAGLISKLQNHNTYLIGLAYSIFGLLQSGAILYVLYQYFYKYSEHDILTIYLILAGLGLFVTLNIIGFIVHSCYLYHDKRFKAWLKSSCYHSLIFWITNSISLGINYKFKQIIFCKIFNFGVFKAELISVQMFKIFNVFSFLGIFGEAELIYALVRQIITDHNLGNDIYMTIIDGLVVLSLNVFFSIAISWKSQDFFIEQIDGILINKKITLEGDFINQTGLKDEQEYHPYFQTRKTGDQSQEVLRNVSNIINEFSDQYSNSYQEQKINSDKNSNTKTKDNLYFQDQDLSSQTLRYKDDLQALPKVLSSQNQLQNKVSIFQKDIQEEQQHQKTLPNEQQVNYDDISQSGKISVKKSENVFCQSPRKKQKGHEVNNKGHYSQQQEQAKVIKIKKNKQIEESASQYNKKMKDKQMKQILRQDSTKMKKSQQSTKKLNSKQSSSNKISQIKEIQNNIIENKVNQKSVNDSQNNKKQLALNVLNADKLQQSQNNQPQQYILSKNNFLFQQVSKSLKTQSQQQQNVFQENQQYEKQLNSRKLQVASLNSSKTYILPSNFSPNNKNVALIDSQSQTVYNQGRLKPQKRQNSIKELQSQNKINKMYYHGEQNSVEEEMPRNNIQKKYYQKVKPQKRKYDKIEQNEKSEHKDEKRMTCFPIEIQNMQLDQSEKSYQMQQIQRSPLGYSPQSRIIQNRQDSRTYSQEQMLLQLNSSMKYQNLIINSDKAQQLPESRLQTIQQKVKQTLLSNEDREQQKSSNNLDHNQIKQKYDKIINTINSQTDNRKSNKKTIQKPSNLNIQNKTGDIYVSINLQQNQIPIRKRQYTAKQRKYPIEQKDKGTFYSNQVSSFDNSSSQVQYSPSKRLSKNRINMPDTLTPAYKPNPATVPQQPKTTKFQSPNKSYKSISNNRNHNHLEFNPIDERINTNSIFGDEIKDELDNLSMQRINFKKHQIIYPQNNQFKTINNQSQGDRIKLSTLISTQMIPKPNVQKYETLTRQKREMNQLQIDDGIDPHSGQKIKTSKSLAIYYNKSNMRKQKSKQRNLQVSRQKQFERSRSRDGTNKSVSKATTNRSPYKDGNKWTKYNNEGKNQISNKRLQQLQKIYLQRLY